MINRLASCALYSKKFNHVQVQSLPTRKLQTRVQVSIIGAASDIGSTVALYLKRNPNLSKLKLYDTDGKVVGIGIELGLIPDGPPVHTYYGQSELKRAIRASDIILMVSRVPRRTQMAREQILASSALVMQNVCRAMADENSDAFLAISCNPINSIVPFARSLLAKYNSCNQLKIVGITHIDVARARSLAGRTLGVNPQHVLVPVVGGHSEDTIIPLFSKLSPLPLNLNSNQADSLTRTIRKAGTEVIAKKAGLDSATLAMVWSINDFLEVLIEAMTTGNEATLYCYTANSHFGTRFFAGPTKVGRHGITQICSYFPMSDLESDLLSKALPAINNDVDLGENYVQIFDSS